MPIGGRGTRRQRQFFHILNKSDETGCYLEGCLPGCCRSGLYGRPVEQGMGVAATAVRRRLVADTRFFEFVLRSESGRGVLNV